METLVNTRKIFCIVVLVVTMVTVARAASHDEAVLLFKGGKKFMLHMVTPDGVVTGLKRLKLQGVNCWWRVGMPDGRVNMFWIDGLASRGFMIEKTPAVDIEQVLTETFRRGASDLTLDAKGERLTYIRGGSPAQTLWAKNLYGSEKPKMLLAKKHSLALNSPSWSPDGSKIAVFYARSDMEAGAPFLYMLLVIDIETGNVKEVAPPSKSFGFAADGGISPPVWHPDGSTIYFRAHYEENMPSTKTFIYKVSSNGGPVTLLAEGRGPMIHPDGDRLYYRRILREKGTTATVVYNLSSNTETLREGLYLWKISPSGKYLACQRQRRRGESYTGSTVVLADKDGQVIKVIETKQDIGWIVGWIKP